MTTLTETLTTIPGLTFKEIPAEECEMTYGAKVTHNKTGMKFVVTCLKDWEGENGGDLWETWEEREEGEEMICSTRDVKDIFKNIEITISTK